MELSALSLRLRALSVLRGLLSHPLVRAYGDTLTALDGTAADFADRYGALCATRFSCGDIAQAVLDAVHFDTNTLTDTINAPEAAVLNAATHDLDVLNALLALDGEAFKSAAADKFYEPALEDLPDFEAADSLPFSTGAALADYYREEGYGFFAQSSAFAMQDFLLVLALAAVLAAAFFLAARRLAAAGFAQPPFRPCRRLRRHSRCAGQLHAGRRIRRLFRLLLQQHCPAAVIQRAVCACRGVWL